MRACILWLLLAAINCSDAARTGLQLSHDSSGCSVDGDCSSTSYCDVTQYNCVPKLAAGEALPQDAQHDGSCTLQNGALWCSSGACNVLTNTCASANGAPCSSAAMCVSDVCGQNQLCGVEEGGNCDSSAAQLCQTNHCSMSSGRCVRANGGCASDADCPSESYCDPAAYSCRPKLAAGEALPHDSLHDGVCSAALAARSCNSGLCNATRDSCAAANAERCDRAEECVSDVCGDNGRCGLALGQAGCSSQTQAFLCQSAHCAASGVCVPAQGCNVDADCDAGMFCNRNDHTCAAQLRAGQALPRDALHSGICDAQLARLVCTSGQCNATTNTCAAETNSACTNHWQCVSDVCADNAKCGEKNGLGACTQDMQCQSGMCHMPSKRCVASEHGCTQDDDCPNEQYCNLTQLRCVSDLASGTLLPVDSAAGGTCTRDGARSVCASGLCNAATDTCAKAGGSDCEADSECAANMCSDGVCGSPDGRSGHCTQDNAASACRSGICQRDLSRCVAANSGCGSDSDCQAGKYCDGRSLACVSQLLPGAKLPSEALHAATCSVEVAAAVCDSAACNMRTNTCANADEMSCNTSSECASDACIDGQCVAATAAISLAGGGCSVATVGTKSSLVPTLLLLWLALLRRRRRERPCE